MRFIVLTSQYSLLSRSQVSKPLTLLQEWKGSGNTLAFYPPTAFSLNSVGLYMCVNRLLRFAFVLQH